MSSLTKCIIVAFIVTFLFSAGSMANEFSEETLSASESKFEKDRRSILSMAGNYHVTFDFIETVPFVDGYEPKERSVSSGYEIVRVIADSSSFISLQHILVVGGKNPFPIKHWRQDWYFEPDSILEYIGKNTWQTTPVSDEEAQGKWSQIVYQVDDAPRYGALGNWNHESGRSQWTPHSTWRPLPRRDAKKRTDYHVMDGVNRHTITPFGWVHEQDNTKLIVADSHQALVRELAVNTYRRDDSFSTDVAETYWQKTAQFWAGIRAEWSRIEAEHKVFGLTVEGEPAALYDPLLDLARAVAAGELETESALKQAKPIVEKFVEAKTGNGPEEMATSK